MNAALEVLSPGLLATVQDLGRHGYQQFGVPVCGAMDAFALQTANLLAGNPRGAAALEFALNGPELKALDERVAALCGADFGATLDGAPLAPWRSFSMRPGQVLRLGRPVSGAWGCLALSGGIAVPAVMRSCSTYLKGRLGGFQGRALAAGDILMAEDAPPAARAGRAIAPAQIPVHGRDATVRVVMGPQDDAFAAEALEAFMTGEFEVAPQSDRMGYRLKGPPPRHLRGADILTDAVAPGSVQVPADGHPIILMADRQPTGGYVKIATVISVDLPKAAQLPPGGIIRFKPVDVAAAQAAACGVEALLETLRRGCGVPE